MFSKLPELIRKTETISYIGKIENVIGMAMESSGNRASIGDIAMIYNEEKRRQIPVEVVGFRGDKMQLMAYENLNGVAAGSFVRNTGKRLKIPVGEFLRGRIMTPQEIRWMTWGRCRLRDIIMLRIPILIR